MCRKFSRRLVPLAAPAGRPFDIPLQTLFAPLARARPPRRATRIEVGVRLLSMARPVAIPTLLPWQVARLVAAPAAGLAARLQPLAVGLVVLPR